MPLINTTLYSCCEKYPGVPPLTAGYLMPNYNMNYYTMDKYWVHFGIPHGEFLRGTADITNPLISNNSISELHSTSTVVGFSEGATNDGFGSTATTSDNLINEGSII